MYAEATGAFEAALLTNSDEESVTLRKRRKGVTDLLSLRNLFLKNLQREVRGKERA